MYVDVDNRSSGENRRLDRVLGSDILAASFVAISDTVRTWRRGVTQIEAPARWRGAHRMLRFNISGNARCDGCGFCVKICPANCITIETNADELGQKVIEKFEICLSKCLFCGLCTDVCPSSAISHSPKFDLISQTPELKTAMQSMITPFDQLKEQPEVAGFGQIGSNDISKIKQTPTFGGDDEL